MSYQSNRTGKEVDRLLDKIDNLDVEEILSEGSFYDVAMSDTSTKAVQNKVIKKYIDDAIANVGGGSDIVVDTEISSTSTNPVQNKVVYSELQKKQGTISDLADIRSGAALGKTALQSVPSEYVTESELTQKGYATREELTSLQDEIIANEEVYAAAANDLLARASDNEERISSEIDARETLQEEFQMLKTSIIENEEVIAATLNDIEGRFGYWSDTYATKKEANIYYERTGNSPFLY